MKLSQGQSNKSRRAIRTSAIEEPVIPFQIERMGHRLSTLMKVGGRVWRLEMLFTSVFTEKSQKTTNKINWVKGGKYVAITQSF
jgi:hypothetical protein